MDSRVCPMNQKPNPTCCYPSAPSSPGRNTRPTLNAYFFSVPTSPSRSDPRTPGSDGFEFGSLEFPQGYDVDGYDRDMTIMAYADELFRGGKMLPLKLPPRLQSAAGSYRKWNSSNNYGRMVMSSTASSPGSTRGSRFKLPFRRKSLLCRDEFDPFAAALEKVKENGHLPLKPKWGWGSLRRSKSMTMGPAAAEANLGRQMEPTATARRQRLQRFLGKTASFGWKSRTSSLGREDCKTALLRNPLHKSLEAPAASRGSAVVRISRGIKSLVKHRPRLFCRTSKMSRR